jgi:hypothetical protein
VEGTTVRAKRVFRDVVDRASCVVVARTAAAAADRSVFAAADAASYTPIQRRCVRNRSVAA